MNHVQDQTSSPQISVIIPFRDASPYLDSCLEAIVQTRNASFELILIDDGSTDSSLEIAKQFTEEILTLKESRGPAFARNRGADRARGEILFFVDADVICHEDTLPIVQRLFTEDSGIDAAIGSYDDAPPARNFLSLYKNLTHHFVHQTGSVEASSFWTGCGAVRRRVFRSLGGFDETYRRPSIEDIELGYRMRAAGHRIILCKELQVQHAKLWTLKGLFRSDICDRAIPWTILQLRYGRLLNDLNLSVDQRVAAVLVWVALISILGAFRHAALALAAAAALLVVVLVNRRLYGFYLQKGGIRFCLGAMGMHFLYYIYSLMAFAIAGTSYVFTSKAKSDATFQARR